MKLIITAPADELFENALYWEVEFPFDQNGFPVTVEEWRRVEFAKRMREVFTDLTGRTCSADYEDDDENENWEGETDEEVRRMYGIEDKGGYTYSLII